MNEKTRKAIEDAILSYCEGVTWVEFNVNAIDDMIDDIETAINNNK